MRDMITAVAVGRANGELIADLCKAEEDAEDAVDMAFAMLTNTGEIALLQMDGMVCSLSSILNPLCQWNKGINRKIT